MEMEGETDRDELVAGKVQRPTVPESRKSKIALGARLCGRVSDLVKITARFVHE